MRNLRLYRTDASFKANEIAAGGDGNKVESIVPGVVKTMDLRKTYFNPHDEAFRVHMINVTYVNEHGVEISPSQTVKVKYIPGVKQEIVITPKEIECYAQIEDRVIVSVPSKASVVFHYSPAPDPKVPLTFKIISGGTLYWKNSGSTSTTYTKVIEYRKNDGEWTSIRSTTGSTASISVAAGDTVQFRGDNATYNSYGGQRYYNCFSASTSVKIDIIGNIMSLINSTDFANLNNFSSSYTFSFLFYLFSGLVNAESMILPNVATAGCYSHMFYGCRSLVTSPVTFPANKVSTACYDYMFYGCSALTTAPSILPATTLAYSCYTSMFSYCTSLTTAPELPATTLANSCYYYMFAGCDKLVGGVTSIGNSATTIPTSACVSMFSGCRSLTAAPELPATNLYTGCYGYMFNGCTSLTTAPELPATRLATYCYAYMFQNCTSLTVAPELPATTLVSSCYYYMFAGCTKLSFIACFATNVPLALGPTGNWVTGVAPTGTFVKSMDMTGWTIGNHGIPNGWVVQDPGISLVRTSEIYSQSGGVVTVKLIAFTNWSASTDDSWITLGQTAGTSSDSSITISISSASAPRSGSVTFVSEVNSVTLTLKQDDDLATPLTFTVLSGGFMTWKTTSNSYAKTINYRVNDGEWKGITSTMSGEYIGNNPESGAGGTYEVSGRDTEYGFVLNGNYYESTNGGTTSSAANCRVNLNLSSSCKVTFHYLCSGHSSSYDFGVFGYVDTALDTGYSTTDGYASANIYSVTENEITYIIESAGEHFIDVKFRTSYYSSSYAKLQFRVTVEDFPIPMLNAGDVVQFKGNNSSCSYNYFSGNLKFDVGYNIMSLVGGDDFAVSNSFLGSSVFDRLFRECSGLINAKNLILHPDVLSVACYYGMFSGCTSLTTAPELPATTLASSCYTRMFQGCTNLVSGVTSIGNSATTIPTSACSYMFYDCTSLTTAPELPATTLTNSCYYGMFYGCISLTTAPVLPATTLASYCYYNMFSDCTSLTTAPVLPATTLASYCYYNMFNGCTSLTEAPELPATTLADSCYNSMFLGCTSLTQAPFLPATTLAYRCYNSMFYGCASLTTAPSLPATTLESNCYNGMFRGCASLTTAPSLPATTLESNCYNGMFRGCTSLTAAPALPATTLASQCYYYMFQGCTSLTTVPSNYLPVTTLASGCYEGMFSDCTSLTTAPVLPATTLANYCYSSMFLGCTSLTQAPFLPATTLAESCYNSMFYGCTSLNYIKCLATDMSARYCTTDWVRDVASTGTFVKNPAAKWGTGSSGIPVGWTVSLYEIVNVVNTNIFCPESAGTRYFDVYAGINWSASTQESWITLSSETGGTGTSIQLGLILSETNEPRTGVVRLASENNEVVLNIYQDNNLVKHMTINVISSGTLYYKTVSNSYTKSIQYSKNNGSWTDIIATTGGTQISVNSGDSIRLRGTGGTSSEGTYNNIRTYFSGDTNVKFNVEGNIMSLLNSGVTFYDKLSITSAIGFVNLFSGCTGLMSIKNLRLPAIKLSTRCYQNMFAGCTSLTEAPELPATTLADTCYYGMFGGCTSLNYIKCLATDISASQCTYSWTNGVANSGTFIKHPNMTSWTTGTSGIPSNWTVQDAQL